MLKKIRNAIVIMLNALMTIALAKNTYIFMKLNNSVAQMGDKAADFEQWIIAGMWFTVLTPVALLLNHLVDNIMRDKIKENHRCLAFLPSVWGLFCAFCFAYDFPRYLNLLL